MLLQMVTKQIIVQDFYCFDLQQILKSKANM